MDKPTLIYFAARGRGEIIRLVLAEAGQDWQEHVVGRGTPPVNGRPTDFPALQATGQLPFNALPVWEEPGGLRLAQSAAIANHLARAHGLRGKTALEEAKVDEALGAADDVRGELRKVFTAAPEQRAAVRAELAEKALPRWFGFLERLLQANRGGAGYLVGESVTVADLALWYAVELAVDNGLGAGLDACPLLKAWYGRVAARPRIAEYLRSARRPAFAPMPK
jgi:glutathione S-transferase